MSIRTTFVAFVFLAAAAVMAAPQRPAARDPQRLSRDRPDRAAALEPGELHARAVESYGRYYAISRGDEPQ